VPAASFMVSVGAGVPHALIHPDAASNIAAVPTTAPLPPIHQAEEAGYIRVSSAPLAMGAAGWRQSLFVPTGRL
jgi:hypothetical protein